jgi:hypothetical protein
MPGNVYLRADAEQGGTPMLINAWVRSSDVYLRVDAEPCLARSSDVCLHTIHHTTTQMLHATQRMEGGKEGWIVIMLYLLCACCSTLSRSLLLGEIIFRNV